MTYDLAKQWDLPVHKIFLGMLESAVIFFERHVQCVNELNVFPVPDGDTGTNMFGTLKGIQSKLQSGTAYSLEDIMKKASEAALLEGRGNSGIILSQIFRGLYEGFDFQHPIDMHNLSSAMDKASERAYGAVGDPVEGTILTVLNDIAITCRTLKNSGTDICNAFGTLHASAVTSVDGTPTKLNVLNEAGVVDSGGYGLEIILKGMELFFREEDPANVEINPRVPLNEGAGMKKILETHENDQEEFGYCTQMTLESSLDYESITNSFKDLGTSTVIIGESGFYRIHTHTEIPENVLDKGTEIGIVSKVSVENMENQAKAMADGMTTQSSSLGRETNATSLAALVSGSGISKLFTEMGASAVWDGGGTLMPSVSEILDMVDKVTGKDVIFMPNNKNAIPASREAAKLSKKNMIILPSENLAQGLECAAEFQSNLDIDSNIRNMNEILPFIKMIAIFSASRSTSINGKKVSAGEIVAMQDDSILGSGPNAIDLLISSICSIKEGPPVIITVLTNAPEQSLAFSETVDKLTKSFGELDENDIEVYVGGQAHYDFLVSILLE